MVHCIECGKEITEQEYEDNSGLCNECDEIIDNYDFGDAY
jgi:DNA-directed RNA polymerase subunit RPC12/RpoP